MRKTVTVLFADLGGSTGFGERTDAEISRRVLSEYHALLQDTIDAHGGTVAKFMGDGMMATFGIPEVAEDDADRAVRSGAALQLRFEAFTADVERRHGETLTLRVGINTGEVVIGDADADLIGDALNVAARLEKACRPGHVLVGEETWRLTRGDIAYQALGEVSVAGRAQPVSIYEVAAADSAPAAEVVAPFVGRDAEMERLVSVFDDARGASVARLVTVLGSPGVGKTRLSREMARQVAKEADAVTFETRCVRSGEATLAPVAQLIRDALDLDDDADADATRAAIAGLLPRIDGDDARVADVLAGLVGAAPTRSVEETFWAIRRLVEAVGAQRPMVIVIDDVQWAEPLLLDLLEHLAEWVSAAPVLLVALARPELREVRPTLAESGRRVAAVLVLDGLDARATEALAAGLLGADRLPVGLVERLPSSTDGNPLFVRELVRMLVDDHVIRARADGEWELTIDAEAVDVPPTIQSLLNARVERLPAPERQLLELASVVGAEFSLGALRELAGEQTPIVALLDAMRRKELVEPTGTYWGDEPVHRFHHVLIRDAAYRRLLKTTRAELHERVAEWTDRAAAGVIGEHEAAIAHHYEQAHRYRTELGTLDEHTEALGRRAAALLTTAAQRALGGDDLASAAALGTRALALLPEADRAARADLLLLACECLLASGNAATARDVVEELGTLAGDDPRLAAWADCFAAQLVGLTDPEGLLAADSQVQSAAAAFGGLDDGSGQAKAHQVRAGILARLGRVGDAEAELDLALAAARLADDRRRVTAVLGAAPDAALFGPSPVARAGGRCLDVVRLLRITSASPSVEAASNRCQAVLEALRGRFDVARSMLATARAAVEELGLRHGLAQTDLFAGMVELIAGDPHAAIPSLRVAFEDLGALGAGADAGIAAALLARAALVDGAVDEADQMASASEALAGQNLKTAVGWRVARAEVMAAQGELAGAVALAEEAVQIAAGTDLIVDHADACAALAQLRAQAGDQQGADAARADAARFYEQKGATVLSARLGDRPEPSTPAPAPRAMVSPAPLAIENGATRALEPWWALQREGRFEEMRARVRAGELFADGFVRVDHRSTVSAEDTDALGIVDAMEALLALGLREITVEPIAVRGERLALVRQQFQSPDGTELTFLILVEIDDTGRFLRSANYDEGQLADAIDELDSGYLAGEGATPHRFIANLLRSIRAMNAMDVDALRAMAAPDFAFVDRRQLGWAALDLDGFLEMQGQYGEVTPNWVLTTLRARDRVAFSTWDSHATDWTGGAIDFTTLVVGVGDFEGRIERIEGFAPEQWEQAVARFEELTAVDPRHPRAENLASRAWSQVCTLSRSGDPAELAGLFAEDYRFVDLRPIVGLGAHDRDGAARVLAATRGEWEVESPTSALAVRGDHLALGRGGWFTEGTESAFLGLAEVDHDGMMVACTLYSEDQLVQAVAELDARYLDDEGVPPQATATISTWAAAGAGDWDGYLEWCSPDFRLIDHRSLAWPELDREGFVDLLRVTAEAVPDMVQVLRKVFVGPRVNLTISDASGTAEGGHFEWVAYGVNQVDEQGRLHRLELFDERDWEAALTRFDELSGAGAAEPPPLENAAMAAARMTRRLLDDGRLDELRELFDDALVARSERWHGRPPQTTDEFVDSLRVLREQYDSVSVESVAVRGDRLCVPRWRLTDEHGNELVVAVAVEVDAEGRQIQLVNFDGDDVSSAVALLDEWFIEGEGAEHADLLRAWARIQELERARDWDVMRAHLTEDYVFADHRRLGFAAAGREDYLALRRSGDAEVVHGMDLFVRLLPAGRAVLFTRAKVGLDGAGSEHEWLMHGITAFDSSWRVERNDLFDAGEWADALACFHELSGKPARASDGGGGLRVENAATRLNDRIFALTEQGRMDEAYALLADGYERIDRRRSVAAPATRGQEELQAALEATLDVGFTSFRITPLAIRGERLALSRAVLTTPDGLQMQFLEVDEVDEDGKSIRSVYFDDDDVPSAQRELDERYLAGEGAVHAEVIRAARRVDHAFSKDPESLHALSAADFALEDHRRLFYGQGDLGHLVSIRHASPDDHVDRTVTVNRTILVEGRALLTAQDLHREDPDGGNYRWRYSILVSFDDEMLLRRLEWFDEDDWDAALARLHELAVDRGQDGRVARIENTATRLMDRFPELARARRFEEMADLVAEGYVRVDHRGGLPAPTSHGPADFVELIKATVEVGFDEIRNTPLAVRGEQLALSRVDVRATDGRELVFLQVHEWDDRQLVRASHYDEADLPAAIMALDSRHAELRGSDYTAGERSLAACFVAWHHHDWTALESVFEPDFTRDDRTKLGMGVHDLASYLQSLREFSELIPGVTPYAAKVYAEPGALLVVWPTQPYEVDGSAFAWDVVYVIRESPSGRAAHLVSFDTADWALALALFDEWSTGAATPSPTLENNATRALERLAAELRARDVDRLGPLYTDDTLVDDRRRGVSSGVSTGRQATLDLVRGFFEVGVVEFSHEVLAVRGDELALVARRFASADGFQMSLLAVVEVDGEGRFSLNVLFDDGDLASALEALEERHLERHGSTMSLTERSHLEDTLRTNRGEDDLGRLAPGYRLVDHSHAGFGTADAAGYQQQLDVMRSLVSSLTIVPAKLHASDRAVLSRYSIIGVDQDGADYRWEMANVQGYDGIGQITESHSFQIEQWDEAVALFDELSIAPAPTPGPPTDPRTPEVDNAAVRTFDRTHRLGMQGHGRLAHELVAEDVVSTDHRQLFGSSADKADFGRGVGSMRDMFPHATYEALAVRGDRLALLAIRFFNDDEFELRMLGLYEVDESGLISRVDSFDDTDLAVAIEALERRYLELAGDGLPGAERQYLDNAIAFNRGELVTYAAGYQIVDHSPAGFGTADQAGYQRQLSAMREMVSNLLLLVSKVYSSERAVLARNSLSGTGPEGTQYRWEMAVVECLDAEGCIVLHHNFPAEQWDEAVAVFDEWSDTASQVRQELGGLPALENAVTRSLERMREVFAAKDWEAVAEQYPEDAMADDRRSGVSSGITSGREGLVSLVRGLADVGFVSFDSETLAIRGDRLALMLRRWQRQDGFELPVLAVQDVDDEGRQAWIALFDADDLVGAIDALEDRYAELCGEAYSEMERRYVDAVHRFNHGDPGAALVGLAPDYLTIDHSPLGFGTSDAAAMGEQVELMAGSVETIVQLSTRRLVGPRSILSLMRMLGTTAEVGDIVWDYATVRCYDADGLVTADHSFQAEQWDEALALFDEWSAAPHRDDGGSLENAATRHSERFRDVLASEGISAVGALLRPDLSYVDHRWGGIAPAGTDADDFLEHVRSARSAGFTTVEFTPLAIRGDRLSLDRWKTVTDAGDLVEHVSVKEVDEVGLGCRTELFALADLPRAVALLDEWYVEGEGAEHAWVVAPRAELSRGFNARDWDGMRRVADPGQSAVDHRLAGAGSTLETFDDAVVYIQGLLDLVPDYVSFDAEYLAIGSAWSLTRQRGLGRSTEGADIEFETLVLLHLADGRISRTEVFAPEQLAEARARFDEVEAEDSMWPR